MARNDSENRVRSHTPPRFAWVLTAACALALAAASSPARAQEWSDTQARVIWTRDAFVYVAADSGVLAHGMPLEILRGRRHVASAAVERLLEPGLALARLQSGSLEREKRLDKLRVRAGLAPVAGQRTLRVGLPSPSRTHLLFACRDARWNTGDSSTFMRT